ncbi:hypothetical protein AAY473_037351 [Plecturocebus cupreus]
MFNGLPYEGLSHHSHQRELCVPCTTIPGGPTPHTSDPEPLAPAQERQSFTMLSMLTSNSWAQVICLPGPPKAGKSKIEGPQLEGALLLHHPMVESRWAKRRHLHPQQRERKGTQEGTELVLSFIYFLRQNFTLSPKLENGGMTMAYCSPDLLGSSNPPTSAS